MYTTITNYSGGALMGIQRRPTLDDIARIAGVSKTAVSMILSEKKGVSFLEETVLKVHDAAKELGYIKKNQKAENHSIFNKNTILVLTPSLSNPAYTAAIQSIEQEAHLHGLRVIVQTTFRDKNRELESLTQILITNLYGIISILTPFNVELLEEINETIPVVVINDKSSGFQLDTVEIDNYSAGVLIAKHMIELGHKNVAYLSTTLDSHNTARVRRLEGIKDTFLELCPEGRILVRSKIITPSEELSNIGIEHKVGYDLALEVLKQKDITAIIAVNDMVAYGAMDALEERNFSIPEDYSLSGFDNLFPSKFKNISLTSVEHYIESKGQNAVDMIIHRHSASSRNYSSTKIMFKHELIIRNSTGRPRTNPSD